MSAPSSLRGDSTRNAIKLAARRLFALRGIHGVTTREIVAATGQKNGGSLHYYFRTKDMLVRELIVDGARIIDERRNRQLDRIEAEGGPVSLRQVLEILVWPATDLGEKPGEEDSYIRFIAGLNLQDRDRLEAELSGQWNGGYQRCLRHIRTLAASVPPEELRRRLVFMTISLRTIMAARESALDHRVEHRHFWTADGTMDSLLATLEAMILGC
jgi:AcrR family transcriptional regulator